MKTLNCADFPIKLEINTTFLFLKVLFIKNDWEDVKVVAEIQERNHNIRFNIKISKQYPELAAYEKLLEEKINAIINKSSLLVS